MIEQHNAKLNIFLHKTTLKICDLYKYLQEVVIKQFSPQNHVMRLYRVYVVFRTIMAISRQKETQSRDYALLE